MLLVVTTTLLVELGKYQVFGLLGLGTGKRLEMTTAEKNMIPSGMMLTETYWACPHLDFRLVNPSFKDQCIGGREDERSGCSHCQCDN
jgi:hypothetical protein